MMIDEFRCHQTRLSPRTHTSRDFVYLGDYQAKLSGRTSGIF